MSRFDQSYSTCSEYRYPVSGTRKGASWKGALCDPDLGPVIAETEHWKLVLNVRNQNLLGKCPLALRRHEETLTALSAEEWADLRTGTAKATDALRSVFDPDHFNYAFLQSMDRHVHLHVLPRYAGNREFSGETFGDGRYPDHYNPFAAPRPLSAEKTEELATLLRRHAV